MRLRKRATELTLRRVNANDWHKPYMTVQCISCMSNQEGSNWTRYAVMQACNQSSLPHHHFHNPLHMRETLNCTSCKYCNCTNVCKSSGNVRQSKLRQLRQCMIPSRGIMTKQMAPHNVKDFTWHRTQHAPRTSIEHVEFRWSSVMGMRDIRPEW